VQQMDEDLETGRVTLSFGQNKLLSAGKLIDIARQNRTRTYSSYQQTMANGGSLAGNSVKSPDAVAKKDSTKGTGHLLG